MTNEPTFFPEEWRPIDKFPYAVSNYGRIMRTSVGQSTWDGKILKNYIDPDGYANITFSQNGKVCRKMIHKLVYEAFVSAYSSKVKVEHLDGNKQNNIPHNLFRWTPKTRGSKLLEKGICKYGHIITSYLDLTYRGECNKCTNEQAKKSRDNAPEYKKQVRKERMSDYSKIYYQNNKSKAQANARKTNLQRFGLTDEDYNKLFIKQKGLCEICKKPETATLNGKIVKLAVDHDHKTGKVRGLLCKRCNLFIGHVEEDIIILQNAIDYLNYYSLLDSNFSTNETKKVA